MDRTRDSGRAHPLRGAGANAPGARRPERPPARWVALAALLLALPCAGAAPPAADLPDTLSAHAEGAIVLTPAVLAQMVVSRNAEVLGSQLGIKINASLLRSETSLYEPAAYADLRHEHRYRLNTVEEQITSSNLPYLAESVNTTEVGLKSLLPSGGDVKLDYQLEHRANNIVTYQSTGLYNAEYTSSVGVTFEQPLWRGAGRDATEAQRRQVEFDYRIAKKKFKLQVLKSLSGALDNYWQLFKWQRVEALRRDGVEQARRLVETTRQRIAAGRVAETALLEAQTLLLNRQADAARARQSAADASASLMSLMRLSHVSTRPLRLDGESGLINAFIDRTRRQVDQPDVLLEQWPALQVADLEQQQARAKSDYYHDQSRPQVNLQVNAQETGFAYNYHPTVSEIYHRRYPDVSIALSIEEPMLGNGRQVGQALAAADRVTQLDFEKEAVRVNFGNDLQSSAQQLQTGHELVHQCEEEVALRQQLYEHETERFKLGSAAFSSLAQKASDLMDARARCADNEAHLEYSKFLFLYYRNVALEAYNIHLDD